MDLRVRVGHALRRKRQARGWTQAQVASTLGSSQSRVAKMEAAAADVSLDLLFRGLFTLGGSLRDVLASPPVRQRKPRPAVAGSP